MLNIYKTDENGLIKKINKIENNSWIDLVNPTLEEIKVVVEKTKIPENLLVVI